MPSTIALDQSSIEPGEGVLFAQSEFEDVKRLLLESSDSSVIVTSETTLPFSVDPSVETVRSSIENYMTLFRKSVVRVVHQPYQSKRRDENGRHAEQALLHQLIVFLCLGDLYLREKIDGYQDRELLSFSDKLCHFVCDLLCERRRR
jgi:hypothetical protein